jgi:hypothetical protein
MVCVWGDSGAIFLDDSAVETATTRTKSAYADLRIIQNPGLILLLLSLRAKRSNRNDCGSKRRIYKGGRKPGFAIIRTVLVVYQQLIFDGELLR